VSGAVPQRAEALQRVRGVIEALTGGGTAIARDGSVHAVFPVATPPAEGEELRGWVAREGATRTIEVGLGYGVSALFICEGLLMNGDEDARHVTIDPHQATRFGDCGLRAIADAGLGCLVEHHAAPSELVLPALLGDGRTFDLAFVDGNHRFDGVFVDLVLLGRLVRPGAIVALDDYQLPAVRRAASFFLTNLGWTLERVSPADERHQWAVLRTSRAPDRRRFDDYADF
jgi:predicted O-methyltransferase YrrM